MMAITKEKLISHLQAQLGMSRQESRQIVEGLFKIIKGTLSQGEDLLISGFGKFSVRQKSARRGRNPQTEESLTIDARKVVVFKTSGVLRRRLNKGFKMPD
jgi:integration host factor subunit alpha